MRYILVVSTIVLLGMTGCGEKGKSEPKEGDAHRPDPSQASNSELKAGDERTFAGIKFCWCPAGEFMMGSELTPEDVAKRFGGKAEFYRGEYPQHRVTIGQGFWMGKFEITNAQFRRFQPDHNSGENGGRSLNADDQPVANVSWDDAQAYLAWLDKKGEGSFRLPSEAQWEYACRAGTTTVRYWADADHSMGEYANFADENGKAKGSDSTIVETSDGYEVSAPVGSFKPNSFGLYDMIGNVTEWCQDWNHDNYTGAPTDGSAWESPAGCVRVGRGGSWRLYACFCRSRYRVFEPPDSRYDTLGFRIVRTP